MLDDVRKHAPEDGRIDDRCRRNDISVDLRHGRVHQSTKVGHRIGPGHVFRPAGIPILRGLVGPVGNSRPAITVECRETFQTEHLPHGFAGAFIVDRREQRGCLQRRFDKVGGKVEQRRFRGYEEFVDFALVIPSGGR